MRLFGEAKHAAKPEGIPVSGRGSITQEQIYALVEDQFSDLSLDQFEETFYLGFIAGLGFVAIEPGYKMHGKLAIEFAENAYHGALVEVLRSCIGDVIGDAFESMGIDRENLNVHVLGSDEFAELFGDGDE